MSHDEHVNSSHSDDNSGRPRGRTRWSRFLITSIATAGMAAVLVGLTANGVLAAEFSISGLPFTVTADNLDGTNFEQFATLDNMIPNSPNAGDTGGQIVVVVSAIQSATLTNLCQSINLGGTNLKITAGGSGTPVSASTLVVDSDQISGDASFQNIAIGQDASTLDKVPGVTGGEGVFGQEADHVTIKNLRQDNFATTAAAFTLPNLSITFSDTGC